MPNKLIHLAWVLIFFCGLDIRVFNHLDLIPSFTLFEVLAYILFLFVLIDTNKKGITVKFWVSIYKPNPYVGWYFIWVVVAAVVGLIHSSDTLQSAKNLVPSFFSYVMILYAVKDERKVESCLWVFLAGVAVNAMIGLSQSLFSWPYLVAKNETADLKMNSQGDILTTVVTGLFNHSNGLGLVLLPGILFCLYFLFRSGKRSPSITENSGIAILLILFTYVLIQTYSKGALSWLAMGMLLLIVSPLIIRARFQVYISILIAGIAASALIALYGFESGYDDLAGAGTMLSRYYLWKAAISVMISDSSVLIFGNGFSLMRVQSILEGNNFSYPDSHNAYLNQMVFYGAPALILYTALFFRTIKKLCFVIDHKGFSGQIRRVATYLAVTLIALEGEYFFEPAEGVAFQAQLFTIIALATVIARAPLKIKISTGVELKNKGRMLID